MLLSGEEVPMIATHTLIDLSANAIAPLPVFVSDDGWVHAIAPNGALRPNATHRNDYDRAGGWELRPVRSEDQGTRETLRVFYAPKEGRKTPADTLDAARDALRLEIARVDAEREAIVSHHPDGAASPEWDRLWDYGDGLRFALDRLK